VRAVRARAPRRAVVLAVASVLPPALLALVFAWQRAAGPLYAGTILINAHWPRELGWEWAWRQSSLAACGPVLLALALGARVLAGRGAGSPPEALESLLAVLAAAGALAYLLTPTPWEQSFLFFVVPWVTGLALVALDRYAATPDALRRDAPFLVATLLLLAATLPEPERLAIWSLVALAIWALLRRDQTPASRLRRAVVLMLLPGAVLFVIDRASDLSENRVAAQAGFARAVSRELAPGESVLVMWDHVLPFRPAATYHWFAHEGVLRLFARDGRGAPALDAEYADAIERGSVRVVIPNPGWLDEYLPRLSDVIARRCHLIANGYAGSDAFACAPGGRS